MKHRERAYFSLLGQDFLSNLSQITPLVLFFGSNFRLSLYTSWAHYFLPGPYTILFYISTHLTMCVRRHPSWLYLMSYLYTSKRGLKSHSKRALFGVSIITYLVACYHCGVFWQGVYAKTLLLDAKMTLAQEQHMLEVTDKLNVSNAWIGDFLVSPSSWYRSFDRVIYTAIPRWCNNDMAKQSSISKPSVGSYFSHLAVASRVS